MVSEPPQRKYPVQSQAQRQKPYEVKRRIKQIMTREKSPTTTKKLKKNSQRRYIPYPLPQRKREQEITEEEKKRGKKSRADAKKTQTLKGDTVSNKQPNNERKNTTKTRTRYPLLCPPKREKKEKKSRWSSHIYMFS